MFQIRDDHEQAFERTAQENFEGRAILHLRANFAAQTAGCSDEALRGRVRDCIDRAGKYGLTTERQVMSFVTATYVAGEHFDTAPEHPWAFPILRDSEFSSDQKARLLVTFAHLRGGSATWE